MAGALKIGERSESMGISPTEAYLLLYNSACALGWIGVVSRIGGAFGNGGSVREAIEASHNTVVVLQLVATLEFIHACIGLVRSSPTAVFMQVIGRDLALFSVVTAFPDTRGSLWALVMFAAWAASEVIRYPFYALSIIGMCPPPLLWLRYTAFVILYPLGFAGELGTWIVGLPHIKALELPGMPKGSVVYLLYVYIFIAFIAAAPKLYLHMLHQRKKHLTPRREPDKAKAP